MYLYRYVPFDSHSIYFNFYVAWGVSLLMFKHHYKVNSPAVLGGAALALLLPASYWAHGLATPDTLAAWKNNNLERKHLIKLGKY